MLKSDSTAKNQVQIWAPTLASEPLDMLIKWILTVQAAGFMNILLVFNGPGAKNASAKLSKKFNDGHVQIEWLSGSGSIGKCQTFVTQIFLQSKFQYLLRIDPDGQFPIDCAFRLLELYQSQDDLPNVVVGFRDESSIGGRMRYIANTVLRLLAVICGIYADLNCGIYILDKRAAALLCQVALSKFPESHMLVTLHHSSLITVTCIVPVLQRMSGRSSIKGFLQCIRLFIESFLECLS